MELKDYLQIVRRRWVLIVATTLIVLAAASAVTFLATPQYASTARVFVTTSESSSSGEAAAGATFTLQRVKSYADLTTSRELAEMVRTSLDLEESARELTDKVSATVVPDTVILELSVTDPDPDQAQLLTQGFAEAMTVLIRELETPPGQTVSLVKGTVVDAASSPDAPVSPQPARNLALGVLLGLLLGLGVAVLREVLDNTIKSSAEVTTISSAPLLGAIAFDSATRTEPLVTSLPSHAPRAEAFRVLRTNLQFVDVDAESKVFVVTSALPAEGKTTTAVNLAITLAQAGQRVLLIEGDLRRPKALEALDIDAAVGVTTVLVGKLGFTEAIQKHRGSDLHILGAGAVPPNPAELLQSRAMAELLSEARAAYDIVIIDAPPLLPVTDAALITAQSDGALLVVRHGKTTRDQVAGAVDRLRQVDGALVGVVINMVPTRRSSGYGYGYGYGYAPQADLAVTPPSTARRGDGTRRGRRVKS